MRAPFKALPCMAHKALRGDALGFSLSFLGGGGVGVAAIVAAADAFACFLDGCFHPNILPIIIIISIHLVTFTCHYLKLTTIITNISRPLFRISNVKVVSVRKSVGNTLCKGVQGGMYTSEAH